MEENKECPICGNNRCERNLPPIIENSCLDFHCSSCGDFKMYDPNVVGFPISDSKKFILAGYLRETKDTRGELTLTKEKIEEILDSASILDGPLEAIDRILKYVNKKSKTAASLVPLEDDDYPIAYAKDIDEFNFFKDQAVGLEYLERGDNKDTYQSFRLTLKGRTQVDELKKKAKKSRQAFVAMWFDEKLQEAFDKAIKPALEETGYKAVRIDLVEHNERIDDKIMEEIRKSGLLIADFTGHRGGVYYEAGFAKALDIPVVWTCREDHLKELHFDTRQYNHIVWKAPEDLKEKLKNRIEATIPIAH